MISDQNVAEEPKNEALYQRAKAEQRAKNWGIANRLWEEFQRRDQHNQRVHSRAQGLPDRSDIYLASCRKRVNDENHDPDSTKSDDCDIDRKSKCCIIL